MNNEESSEHDYSLDPLTFIAHDTCTFIVQYWGGVETNELFYSLDNGDTWTKVPVNSDYNIEEWNSPVLNAGDTIMWKGTFLSSSTAANKHLNFFSFGEYEACGNILSLLDETLSVTTMPAHAFRNLFENGPNNYHDTDRAYKNNLVSVKNLVLPPFTSNSCYMQMFQYNFLLEEVFDTLPSTSLSTRCYQQMFVYCQLIETAPTLPALTLVDNCYRQMFDYCKKLNYVKAMFTTTPGTTYTTNWLRSVSNTGTFVKNVNAMWDVSGANGVPSGWTIETATPN